MGANSEYYIRLREEEFNNLPLDEQLYLNRLGMEVRQKEDKDDLENDEVYKKLRKARIDAWNKEQDYLFKKRNKMSFNNE